MDALLWEDDASERLLDDLFTFLDGEPPAAAVEDATSLDSRSDGSVASPSSTPTPHRKRAKAKPGCPIKRTLDALRDETAQLTQTLDQLRQDPTTSATEVALTERFKRRRAEHECEQLRDAVYAQAQFLRGLQTVFSSTPPTFFASGLNLCRHLHNYTKLPRDRSVRWHEYATLSQETRLRRAMDILSRETEALTCATGTGSIDAPHIQTEVLNDATGFGVTAMSVFAVATRDVSAVLRGACVAVRDIVQRCKSYECTSLKRQIVDPEASSNLLYSILGVHHKSRRADSDELSVESRIVTLYKQMDDDHAVVLWDFVDDDELHPTLASTDITRQAIGACLIRREMGHDGVERSVCRILNTRRYHFHTRDASSEAVLARFQSLSIATNRENELLFRGYNTMDALLWEDDDDDDAASSEQFLEDLSTFLDGVPTPLVTTVVAATSLGTRSGDGSDGSSTSPPATTLNPGASRRKRAKPKGGCPIKRTLDALRDEAAQLTETLDQLRQVATTSANEVALTERFKRRRAEHECEQLRDAVYAQAQFLRGLQTVLSMPPPLSSLNLCRHLHNYTKLPRDRSVRWNEYAALSQETRLRRAMAILSRETEALIGGSEDEEVRGWTGSPCIQTEVLTHTSGFGVTAVSVFAVETKDLGAVLRGACVAIRDLVQRCSSYECTSLKRQIVDPEALSSSSAAAANMLYSVLDVHHKSRRADNDELSIESRIITLYKQMDDEAVVLWDFVDDDELHPTTASTDITRESVGACLIRREICGDGVERSVCRVMNTRRYRFHYHDRDAMLTRFQSLSVTTKTTRENELYFRGFLLDAIATEEAAYARMVSQ